jgi:hypothetical protein
MKNLVIIMKNMTVKLHLTLLIFSQNVPIEK